jgi:transcriptional regulator with XRE-family HTH domain
MHIADFLEIPAAELARITETSKTRWSLYLNDKESPTLSKICKMAQSLDMQPPDLVAALLIRIEMQKDTQQALDKSLANS